VQEDLREGMQEKLLVGSAETQKKDATNLDGGGRLLTQKEKVTGFSSVRG